MCRFQYNVGAKISQEGNPVYAVYRGYSKGIITPVFQEGDNAIQGIVNSLVDAARNEKFSLNDGDIIGVTETVVARTQGNYATCEQIAKDIRTKLGAGTLVSFFQY